MFEFPQVMDRNNYCTPCAECVKGCARDNLALRFRAFGRDLWATSRRALDEAYFAVALVGLTLLVTAGMLSGRTPPRSKIPHPAAANIAAT